MVVGDKAGACASCKFRTSDDVRSATSGRRVRCLLSKLPSHATVLAFADDHSSRADAADDAAPDARRSMTDVAPSLQPGPSSPTPASASRTSPAPSARDELIRAPEASSGTDALPRDIDMDASDQRDRPEDTDKENRADEMDTARDGTDDTFLDHSSDTVAPEDNELLEIGDEDTRPEIETSEFRRVKVRVKRHWPRLGGLTNRRSTNSSAHGGKTRGPRFVLGTCLTMATREL